MTIAESYTLSGLAIYLRDTYGMTDFPKPKKYAGFTVSGDDTAPPIRMAVDNPGPGNYATDPNDSNSKPFDGDWINIFGADTSASVQNTQQLGQTARCSDGTHQLSNTEYLLSDGKTQSSIRGIAYSLRDVLCNDKCELPAGISADNARATPTDDGNGCEISVAMPNSAEIYLYRKTHSQGTQWQECWDYTDSMFDMCLIRGPNASDGWVNGEQQFQFYQGGVRDINNPNSFAVKAGHPLDTSKTLQFADIGNGHGR
jgi:hypothetical protein